MNIQRDDSEDLDIRELIARLWQRRVLIAMITLAVALLFAVMAFLVTPVYRAKTVLAPVQIDGVGSLGSALGSLGGLASVVGVDIGGSGASEMEQALAVLRSREFTENFIRELNLMPVLFADKWNKETKQWAVPADEQPTAVRAFKYFNGLRTAAEDKKTGLVTVEIDWKEPELAASWTNELIARLNEVMRQRAIKNTNGNITFLEKEMSSTTSVETRNAIGRLMESQINKRMLANVTGEYAFRVVDKALPPDPTDPVRPKKGLLIMLGLSVGLIVGSLVSWVVGPAGASRVSKSASTTT